MESNLVKDERGGGGRGREDFVEESLKREIPTAFPIFPMLNRIKVKFVIKY